MRDLIRGDKMKKITKILLALVLVLGMVISPLQGTGSINASAADENPMRALWLRPNGSSVDGVGIEPDYNIDNVIVDNILEDKQFDKALQLFR